MQKVYQKWRGNTTGKKVNTKILAVLFFL